MNANLSFKVTSLIFDNMDVFIGEKIDSVA